MRKRRMYRKERFQASEKIEKKPSIAESCNLSRIIDIYVCYEVT